MITFETDTKKNIDLSIKGLVPCYYTTIVYMQDGNGEHRALKRAFRNITNHKNGDVIRKLAAALISNVGKEKTQIRVAVHDALKAAWECFVNEQPREAVIESAKQAYDAHCKKNPFLILQKPKVLQ